MIFAIAVIALASFDDQSAGPIDGFKLNMTQVHAHLRYQHLLGTTSYEMFQGDRIWSLAGSVFIGSADKTKVGEWSFDGKTERFVFDAPNPAPKSKIDDGITTTLEVLCDEAAAAYHIVGHSVINLKKTQNLELLTPANGPFHFWSIRFPWMLGEQFPNVQPIQDDALIDGRPMAVSRYIKDTKNGWYLLEIYYDSSINYLNKYMRGLLYNNKAHSVTVSEHYILDTYKCEMGGFVPTEWIQTRFTLNDVGDKKPENYYGIKLATANKIRCGHFKATHVSSLDTTVALSRGMELAGAIFTPGGTVKINKGNSLDMNAIYRNAGYKLAHPIEKRRKNLVDLEEKKKFAVKASKFGVVFFLKLIALPFIFVVAWAVKKNYLKNSKSVMLFVMLGLPMISGCVENNQGKKSINVTPKKNVLIVNPSVSLFSAGVDIVNTGSSRLKIVDLDGGCSCRQIDKSALPFILNPGEKKTVNIKFAAPKYTKDYRFAIKVKSISPEVPIDSPKEYSMFTRNVNFTAIPESCFQQDTLTLQSISENDEPILEFSHKAFINAQKLSENRELVLPDQFKLLSKTTTNTVVEVSESEKFTVCEQNFKILLIDKKPGENKVIVKMKNGANQYDELPVYWQRVPFISFSPNRVILGPKPCRIFLNCRDKTVEIKSIVLVPVGLRAFVSSPRSIEVSLTDDAPAVIDENVQITTNRSDDIVKIRVVRFNKKN